MPNLLVQNITVGGSQSYGGGLAYNLNVEVSKDTSPTKATLQVVNKNGVYNDIQLSTTNLTTIQAGSYSIKMCPIAYKVTEKAGQKIMSVTFEDGSVILDKIYVGLLGEFMSITGERTYRGTIQYFSQAAAAEITYVNTCAYIKVGGAAQSLPGNVIIMGQEIIDPRNPCGTNNIKYTFNQLITAIRAKGIIVDPFASNDHYYQQYVGNLRQVLASWCADYGFSFYWDNDTLKFIDCTQKININAVIPDNTETLSYGKSLEGSYKQIGVAAFRKGREEQSATATSYRLLFFRCLRMTDLFPGTQGEELEKQAILAYFSDELRMYYLLTQDPQGLGKCGFNATQAFDSSTPFFIAVKADLNASTDPQAKALYNLINAGKGYLVKSPYAHPVKTANYDALYTAARSFIGKYYICNQSLTPRIEQEYFTQSSTIKVGGSATVPRFVQADATLSSLSADFAQIIGLGASNESIFGANPAFVPDVSNPAAASWVFPRNGVWQTAPSPQITNAIHDALEQNGLLPTEVGTSFLTTATIAMVTIADGESIWYIPNPDSNITIDFNYGNNFGETDTVSINSAAFTEVPQDYNSCQGCIDLHEKDLRNQLGAQFQSRFGLLNNGNAPTVTIVGYGINLQLIAPSQADYQAIEVVQRTRKIIIPKIDEILYTGDLLDGDYMEGRVQQKNATIDYILNLPANFAGVIDISQIKIAEKAGTAGNSDVYEYLSVDAYLRQVLASISHGSEGTADNKEIREAGYPSINPTPADGLQGITVEYTENGVFTTYKFNSRPKLIPSLDELITQVNSQVNPSIFFRNKT